MRRIIYILLLTCVYTVYAHAETSTNTDVLFHTWYSSPAFADGEFSGTMFRDFEGNSLMGPTLLAQVDMTDGVWDTAIRSYFTHHHVDSVHPKYWVAADYNVTATGAGDWWVGPKINVNFDGWPNDWYENYVVENSSRTPATWDSTLTGLGGSYLGQTTHNGSVYKHYHLPWVTWHQIWAIRQTYRNGGRVSVKRILRFWRKNGVHNMPNHNIDEMRINVEVVGQVDFEADIDNVYIPENYTINPDPKFPLCVR